MMQEGYAGGSALSRNANNLLGWEIMREASVTDRDWQRLTDTYVRDQHDLKIREWFDAHNPHAFQELTVTLLESIRKEFWQADEGTIREIAAAYAESVARHGLGGGIRAGGNTRLEKFVEGVLAAAGTADMDALLDQYRKRGQAQARAPEPSAGGADTVKGRKMEPTQAAPPDSSQPPPQGMMLFAVVALAMLIVLAGFVRKGARRRKPLI
jgi:cobaltochelatase CobN